MSTSDEQPDGYADDVPGPYQANYLRGQEPDPEDWARVAAEAKAAEAARNEVLGSVWVTYVDPYIDPHPFSAPGGPAPPKLEDRVVWGASWQLRRESRDLDGMSRAEAIAWALEQPADARWILDPGTPTWVPLVHADQAPDTGTTPSDDTDTDPGKGPPP